MKKIAVFIAIVAFVSLSSCKKFLDSDPYSITTTENFYKTPAEAELALTGVYVILNAPNVQGQGNVSTFARDLTCAVNAGTDEVIYNGNAAVDPNLLPFGTGGVTSDNPTINNWWFFFYAGINRANFLLEKLEGINGFAGNRKLQIAAEARLLRGFYHMYLSMLHGGVPAYNISFQDPKQPRNSIQEVYKLVLEDYEFAFNNLPNRAGIAGRANKWTAAGLLVKAYTYLASAKTSGTPNFGLELNSFAWVNANDFYQKALSFSTQIVQNSNYRLLMNYDVMFREAAKTDQYQESLLTAEASTDPRREIYNMLTLGWAAQGNGRNWGGSFGWFRPTGEVHRRYHTTGDVRFFHNLTSNFPGANVPSEIVLGVRYFIPSALPTNNTNPNVAGFSMGKYRAMDPSLRSTPDWANSINLSLLRYADILLLHAEAQFFTGDEAGARNTLTLVRQRAVRTGSTVATLNTAYLRANFLDELLEERSRELCFEQWRRIDLARFNKYNDAIANLSTSASTGFYNVNVVNLKQNWKPERIWFPIPLSQIELNSNLVPNPGY